MEWILSAVEMRFSPGCGAMWVTWLRYAERVRTVRPRHSTQRAGKLASCSAASLDRVVRRRNRGGIWVAWGLQIPLDFAAICRGKALIWFRISRRI